MYRVLVAMLAVFATTRAAPAMAQPTGTYPSRVIRIVSPFPPGGNTDRIARLIGLEMGKTFGQNVLVENRAGGGGIVGTDAVAKSAPDGHTMGIIISAHAVHPAMHAKLPYDAAADFTPISLLLRVPNLITVHPSLPVRSLGELLDLARKRPAEMVYATAGVGSATHLSGELLDAMAKTKMTPVHYKGGGPAVQDLIGGQIPMSINNLNVTLPFVRAGRVRAMAVTSPLRSPVLPDTPAVAETVPGYQIGEWYMMIGPKNMPREVVAKIQGEIARILNEPALKARFLKEEGVELVGGTSDEAAALLKAELARWPDFVRKLGIKAE